MGFKAPYRTYFLQVGPAVQRCPILHSLGRILELFEANHRLKSHLQKPAAFLQILAKKIRDKLLRLQIIGKNL